MKVNIEVMRQAIKRYGVSHEMSENLSETLDALEEANTKITGLESHTKTLEKKLRQTRDSAFSIHNELKHIREAEAEAIGFMQDILVTTLDITAEQIAQSKQIKDNK